MVPFVLLVHRCVVLVVLMTLIIYTLIYNAKTILISVLYFVVFSLYILHTNSCILHPVYLHATAKIIGKVAISRRQSHLQTVASQLRCKIYILLMVHFVQHTKVRERGEIDR